MQSVSLISSVLSSLEKKEREKEKRKKTKTITLISRTSPEHNGILRKQSKTTTTTKPEL